MKFENLEEIKAFVLWAKKEKVQHVKIGNIEFLFSNLALLEEEPVKRPVEFPNSSNIEGNPATNPPKAFSEEDELLFWSSSKG